MRRYAETGCATLNRRLANAYGVEQGTDVIAKARACRPALA